MDNKFIIEKINEIHNIIRKEQKSLNNKKDAPTFLLEKERAYNYLTGMADFRTELHLDSIAKTCFNYTEIIQSFVFRKSNMCKGITTKYNDKSNQIENRIAYMQGYMDASILYQLELIIKYNAIENDDEKENTTNDTEIQ